MAGARRRRLLEALAKDHLAVNAAINFVVHILNTRACQEPRHRGQDVISLYADGNIGSLPVGDYDGEKGDGKKFLHWFHNAFSCAT